ncbi:hypothetical protein [Saccharopolyspora spinosa]|uniref:hypothetical protein n=1 Tax=Saccharopolyspora spinosa TaxID=60894 RepID=UPI0002F0E43E|nr:hypothetical protein [Saccharopolyspora spinosa]
MIAALVAVCLLGVGGLAVWATFYYAPAQHAGSGEEARPKPHTSGVNQTLGSP